MSTIISACLLLATLLYAGFALRIIQGLLKPSPESPENTELPDVAVVVAARNEEPVIEYLLKDLLSQDYAGKLEIIIANDRSTDGTGRIIDQYARKHDRVTAVHISALSAEMTPKKYAITQALKRTTAEIILGTDADCNMGPGWVSSAVKHFDPQIGILVGYAEIDSTSLFEQYQALDYIGVVVANAGMMAHGLHWSGSGGNLAYRRSAFTEIGGFSAVADRLSGDDFYLVQAIPKRTGLQAKFNRDPDHFVTTRPTQTLQAYLNQRIRWSSNSRGLEKSDPLFFSFLVSAFLSNFLILLAILSGGIGAGFWWAIWIKFLAEGGVMLAGAKQFNYNRLIWVYPVWFLIQPLYISYVGLMGLRGKFTWKP